MSNTQKLGSLGFFKNVQDNTERIVKIALSNLVPYPRHTFDVVIDDLMWSNVESIKVRGDVEQPIIVRERGDGKYEVVSGHRRVKACELAGLTEVSAIIRDLTDEEADKLMVETNQHRTVNPIEKARSCKLWVDADKKQRGRPTKNNYPQVGGNSENSEKNNYPQVGGNSENSEKNNSPQVGGNSESDDVYQRCGKAIGVGGETVRRFIRLLNLVEDLQVLVAQGDLPTTTGFTLSSLSPEEQTELLDIMQSRNLLPSLDQAEKLKRLSKEKTLTREVIEAVLEGKVIAVKKAATDKKKDETFSKKQIKSLLGYFPKETPINDRYALIEKLLAEYFGKN